MLTKSVLLFRQCLHWGKNFTWKKFKGDLSIVSKCLCAILNYVCIVCVAEDKLPDTPSSEMPTKTEPDKALKPQFEKAAKAAAVLGKPVKPNLSIKTSLERPKSKDKATKTIQSSEKTNKSPPPPPPRRNYINSTGVISTRSGEAVYSCRKESGSAQVLFVFVYVYVGILAFNWVIVFVNWGCIIHGSHLYLPSFLHIT